MSAWESSFSFAKSAPFKTRIKASLIHLEHRLKKILNLTQVITETVSPINNEGKN